MSFFKKFPSKIPGRENIIAADLSYEGDYTAVIGGYYEKGVMTITREKIIRTKVVDNG